MFSLWIKVLGTNVFVNSDYWGQISGIRLNLLICFRLSLHLTHPSPTFGTICQYLVPFGTIQHLWHHWHQAVQLAPFGTILKPFSMLWYHLAPFFTIGSRWVSTGTIWWHFVPFGIISYHFVPLISIQYHWVLCGIIGYHFHTIGYLSVSFGIIRCIFDPFYHLVAFWWPLVPLGYI